MGHNITFIQFEIILCCTNYVSKELQYVMKLIDGWSYSRLIEKFKKTDQMIKRFRKCKSLSVLEKKLAKCIILFVAFPRNELP